jgi:ribosomal protein S18 acetylase RimI-like enzyme
MPLPILQTTQEDLLRYYHRAQLQWARHLGSENQLDFGVAIFNPQLHDVHDANRILDAVLQPEESATAVIAQADAFFVEQGCRCQQWTLNESAPLHQRQRLENELQTQNYRRRVDHVMRLVGGPSIVPIRGDLQILPARASFRHARQIAEQSADHRGLLQLADASMLHLDDPLWDALLALKDGVVVGRLGVLSVGEIGLIENVFVAEPFRRQGVAATLLTRAIEICQRSLFRHVLLGVESQNSAAISLYQKFGFTKVAEAVAFISS